MSAESMSLQLAPLRQQLDEALSRHVDLPAVRRRRPLIEALLSDLDGALEQEDSGAVVCLVGSTGAGKSTLINALAGHPIARSGISRPTTTRPTVYVPDDADLSRLPMLSDDASGGVELVRYTPDDTAPWSGQIFIDAPDVNSVADVHRERVSAMVAGSDVLVVVMHRQSITERSPVSFLDDWHDRRKLIFVLNRRDELVGEAQVALTDQIRRLAAERWSLPDAPVFAISAQQALVGRQQGGLPPLVAALEALAEGSELRQVRRHRVLGVISRLSAEAEAISSELQADLEGLPADLQQGLSVVAEQLSADSARRLSARRVDVAAQFADEVGRRWSGPGGFLIRAGGLTGLGAAVGALVTRRTLIGGAAVVGASALADQGSRQLRQWRVEAGTDLLPTPSDLSSWTEQALVGVAARLRRLGIEAPLILQPSWIAEQTLESLGDTWRGIVHRDLPEAASQAGHVLLRLLLDLPIWGALGWIVYRVADGYLAGDHEGMAFLIDTVILVATYALIERAAILGWIRWRVGRVIEQIEQQLTARLLTQQQAMVAACRAQVAERQEALAVLSGASERWRQALGTGLR
ncbi:MAG: energy-coupling factor transporter ATP-binding protein EcfA2 [Myxococcota bacterium]|jgi:energy-coupling factor transporter ATP-binding protein EcfA2